MCERESDSKGHFTNAACQGGGEQHSNSSITTIEHTSNQERESERCHRSREGRGKLKGKRDDRQRKRKIQTGRKKKARMLERDNYHRHVYFLHILMSFQIITSFFSAEHTRRNFKISSA